MADFKKGTYSAIDFRFEVENLAAINKRFDVLAQKGADFKIPFSLISQDFYRSNKKLFTLKGAGLYQDLAPSTKAQKQREIGQVYPILVGQTRKLSKSVLGPRNPGSVNFIGSKSLVLGSTIEYGIFHQSDQPRRTLPQRKFVFIDGGPADRSGDSSIAGRRERWINMVDDYLFQITTGELN